MIPKRIFYVWGVNDDKKRDVLACMQSWRQNCPDYEIIEINEASTEYFNFQEELNNNRWFKTVYERKMWAYVADYIRIKTLYNNGGIYLDTDVTVLKPFDKFLNDPAFVGIQCSGQWNYVEPAILGAQKGNKFLENILDFYNKKIWEEPIYTMPQIFEYYLQRIYNIYSYPSKNEQEIIELDDLTIYPEKFFIPFEYGQKFHHKCIEEDTHTIHWFGGSWCNEETRFFLTNKHKIDNWDLFEYKKYQILKLFNFIPLIKISHKEKELKGIFSNITYLKLFAFIPLLKIIKNEKGKKIKLFDFITIFRITKKNTKTKYYIFNFIPFFSIRKM